MNWPRLHLGSSFALFSVFLIHGTAGASTFSSLEDEQQYEALLQEISNNDCFQIESDSIQISPDCLTENDGQTMLAMPDEQRLKIEDQVMERIEDLVPFDDWEDTVSKERRLHWGGVKLFLRNRHTYDVDPSKIGLDWMWRSSASLSIERDSTGLPISAVVHLTAQPYKNGPKYILAAFGLNFNRQTDAVVTDKIVDEFPTLQVPWLNPSPDLFVMNDFALGASTEKQRKKEIRKFFHRVVHTYLFQDDFWLGPKPPGDRDLDYKSIWASGLDGATPRFFKNRKLGRTVTLVSWALLLVSPVTNYLPISLGTKFAITGSAIPYSLGLLGANVGIPILENKGENSKRYAEEYARWEQIVLQRSVRADILPRSKGE